MIARLAAFVLVFGFFSALTRLERPSEPFSYLCSYGCLLAPRVAILEGWLIPTSKVRRLHNPGALAYAGQRGASRSRGGVARFRTDREGWEALTSELDRRVARATSPKSIFDDWSTTPGYASVALVSQLGPKLTF